jgi:hypothetical protein
MQKYFKQIQSLTVTNTEYIRNVNCAILNTVFENAGRRVNKCLETSFYGAGGIPPSALQPFEAYCAKARFTSPLISRGAPRQTAWETSISERGKYGREMAGQI